MSHATTRGEGKGAYSRYGHHSRTTLPYLQKNVRRALQSLTMGSTLSSFNTPTVEGRSREEANLSSENEEEEEDIRPAKRRKTGHFDHPPTDSPFKPKMEASSPQSFRHRMNGMKPRLRDSGSIAPVPPSGFYGKCRPSQPVNEMPKKRFKESTPDRIASLIPENPIDFKGALRLDIGVIVEKYQQGRPSFESLNSRETPIDIKCRCSVELFSKDDKNPSIPSNGPEYSSRVVTSRTCILRSTIGEEGNVVRELVNLDPFFITAEEIYINRRKHKATGGFENTFTLAEKYLLQVKLEPIEMQREWPPFDISHFAASSMMGNDGGPTDETPITDLIEQGNLLKSEVHLICKTPSLLEPNKQTRLADLRLSYGSLRQKTPFALSLNALWSLPSVFSPTHGKMSDGLETNRSSPVMQKKKDTSLPNSPANRSQRQRSNVTTYNLKYLSALQQGRPLRVNKNRDFRSKSVQRRSEEADDTTVTYTFGKSDSAELVVKRETTIAGLNCPFCNCNHRSLEELKVHLHTNHSAFKYSLRRSTPPRLGFFIELAKNSSRSSPVPMLQRARIFQLNKPQTLFDLEKFLNGGDSWSKAREGPQHNSWPEHLHDQFGPESSLSSSPHESRQSSPNTSNATDDILDSENYQKLPVQSRKIFFVPKTNRPLFDTMTKRVLEPGEEIPLSDDEKEENWLHQKHRDIILDYADVTDDEKDYILRWNPFIMEARLTSELHLPGALLRFVKENRFWFAKRWSRKREFCKTMETFLMRGIINHECLHKCSEILKTAEKSEAAKEKNGMDMDMEESMSPARGLLDCECGEPTHPSDRVVCSGNVSSSSHMQKH